jgi:hypothetical protein
LREAPESVLQEDSLQQESFPGYSNGQLRSVTSHAPQGFDLPNPYFWIRGMTEQCIYLTKPRSSEINVLGLVEKLSGAGNVKEFGRRTRIFGRNFDPARPQPHSYINALLAPLNGYPNALGKVCVRPANTQEEEP